MLDFIFRSIIVEFLGVLTKWLYYVITNKIKGKEVIRFYQIWEGRKSLNSSEYFLHGISNIAFGYLVLIGMIAMGFIINAIWY